MSHKVFIGTERSSGELGIGLNLKLMAEMLTNWIRFEPYAASWHAYLPVKQLKVACNEYSIFLDCLTANVLTVTLIV